jgi:acyl carrier protein
MQDIKAQVREYIKDNFLMGARGSDFADTDSFMEKHILDSTGFLELIAYLEESFGIAVADEEMTPDNLDSLDKVAAYIGRKRAT